MLGVLNSSAACFWLKQVCHNKGGGGIGGGMQRRGLGGPLRVHRHQAQEFPLPADLPLDLGRELDRLAQLLAARSPPPCASAPSPPAPPSTPPAPSTAAPRRQMIALQEELDWTVYRAYGLITEAEAKTLVADSWVEPVALGERAFEIVLARKVAAGEAETAWFDRHGSTPITELPAHWSDDYRAVVEARIDVIERAATSR